MTHSTGQIEEIGENARQNGATLARLCARVDSLESAAKAAELRAELNARRIEEVADKTAQRLDAIEARHRKADAHRKQLRNGPKSYDKRIAALELTISRSFAILSERIRTIEHRDDDPLRRPAISFHGPVKFSGTGDDTTAANCDGSCQAAEDAMYRRLGGVDENWQLTADEQRSIDRHVADEMQRARLEREERFLSSPVRLAGNDVSAELDAARSSLGYPVSRDIHASVSVIEYALSEHLHEKLSEAIDDGLDRTEAVNRVELRARQLMVVVQTIANRIAEENL